MTDSALAPFGRTPARRWLALPLSLALGGLLLALLFAALRPPAAAAAGLAEPAVAYPCTEPGLNSALAAGGSANFTCGAPTTVTVSAVKSVLHDISLDGGNNLILSGGGISGVFTVPAGIHLTLLNLTLRDSPVAIINNGVLNVTHAHFISDTAAALFNEPGAVATVSGTTVTGGFTKGGAIFNGGFLVTQTASLSVINSTFHDNAGGFGAAIFNEGGPVTVTGSLFQSNHSFLGGAIYSVGSLQVSNSQFIFNTASPTLTVAQSQLAAPSGGPEFPAGIISGYLGGAIYSSGAADLILAGSSFTQNSSVSGGGAVMFGNLPTGLLISPTTGSLTVTGSTFSGNCTGGPGGALFAGQGASVSGSTFTANRADSSNPPCLTGAAAQPNALSQAAPAQGSAPAIVLPVNLAGSGGAIFSDLSLAVDSSNFLSNSASFTGTGGGGAISTYFASGLSVANSTFAANSADQDGGAIFNAFAAVATISAGTFQNNIALNSSGGAISNLGALTVTHSSFSGNGGAPGLGVLGGGGAIFSGLGFAVSGPAGLNGHVSARAGSLLAPAGIGPANYLYLDHSTFISNASKWEGGAVDAGPAVISTSTFSGNSAAYGGAIDVWNGPFTLMASTFTANAAVTTTTTSARQGGAIDTNNRNVAIVNSTFYQNRAEGGATGGALNIDSNASVAITNTTFLSDTADVHANGGTLAVVSATVVLRDVLLAYSGGVDCSLPVTLSGKNLEFGDASCGAATVTANPHLLPPANNGGPTFTAALQPGSPAIDAGDNAGCPGTDQRGAHRPVNGTCDIGAYEFGAQLPWLWLPVIRR